MAITCTCSRISVTVHTASSSDAIRSRHNMQDLYTTLINLENKTTGYSCTQYARSLHYSHQPRKQNNRVQLYTVCKISTLLSST